MGAWLRLLGRSPWASPPAGVNYSSQRPPARPLRGLLLPPPPRAPAAGMEEGSWGGEEPRPGSQETVGAGSALLPICCVPIHPPVGPRPRPLPGHGTASVPGDTERSGASGSALGLSGRHLRPDQNGQGRFLEEGRARPGGAGTILEPTPAREGKTRPSAPRRARGPRGRGRANLRTGPDLRSHLPGLRGAGPTVRTAGAARGAFVRRPPAGQAPAPAPAPRAFLARRGAPSGVNSPSSSGDPRPWPPPAQAPGPWGVGPPGPRRWRAGSR